MNCIRPRWKEAILLFFLSLCSLVSVVGFLLELEEEDLKQCPVPMARWLLFSKWVKLQYRNLKLFVLTEVIHVLGKDVLAPSNRLVKLSDTIWWTIGWETEEDHVE